MKPQNLHAHEDRLLDFVYGELPPLEARAVESHVEGCSRCSEMLAGIRGVRTTMAQLPMEPAPNAGLESLLAYAQQAARNAAAGATPRPTWWRRWLMPAMGVAVVTVFGVVAVQANKAMDREEEVVALSTAQRAEEPPLADREPEALLPSAPRKAAPQAQMAQAPSSPPSEEYAPEAQVEGATPSPPAQVAKLDRSWMAKEASRAKPSMRGKKSSRSDWGNAGAGAGFGDSKNAYESDRRDAMTQAGPFSKSKPILVGSAPEEEPSQDAIPEPSTAGGLLAESEAQVEQQAPSQGSLRVGGSRSRGAENESARQAEDNSSDDFDDMFGGRQPLATREQRAPSPAGAPPPPPPTASAAPKPSVSTTMPSANRPAPATRDEAKAEEKRGPAPVELARQAEAALRSGNRVQEAQLLRQALAAGATGKERLGLLNRLCDAEFAIGRRQAAFEACSLVLEEAPRSSAAQVARSRLRREGLEDSGAKAGTGSRGPLKSAHAYNMMEAPAPAQAQ